MKKQISKIISVALVCVIMLALTSCGGINIGKMYTGGFEGGQRIEYNYYWVETYEECMEGIERLKSHGSTFTDSSVIVSYEGPMFDMKYCIKIYRRNADKEAGIFVNRYDRQVKDVEVLSFAFFDDVKIDDLLYSYTYKYKVYQIILGADYAAKCDLNYTGITADMLECTENVYNGGYDMRYEYRVNGEDDNIFIIQPSSYKHDKPSSEMLQNIIDSIDVDSYNYMQQ